MIRLSLIVPVYNVERWVARCLESCLNQDIPKEEYEIIVVNDGTPDCSIERVKEIQTAQIIKENKNNIHIINRENGGLSTARNTGIEHAKGKYIWFIDSDDWIEPNCINSILQYAENNQLDVHCFGLQLVNEDGQVLTYNIPFNDKSKIYSGEDFICEVGMPPAAWCALYRKDFLRENNLIFMEGLLHEDLEFTPRAYFLAKRMAYSDRIVYNYFQRTGGIMKSNQSAKRCKDFLIIADSLYDFMQNHTTKGSDAYKVFQDKINFAFSQSLAYFNHKDFKLDIYKKKPYFPLVGSLNWKYRLMNISLQLYLLIYKMAKR